ncbi:methyltransferase domain-containing protein [Streptomyces sp. NPDC059209]|uniref:methyltransferase domain-containing protein n=1 Tax=Streptomyces sp. NPDC059209 TaxID=3346769 RepID=UPI00368BF4C6
MFEERRIALAAAMEERGGWPDDSPWVRAAVDAVPRHSFAPDTLWRWDGDAYVAVSRATEPERWAAEVYGGPGDPAVTQVADGRATSSLSCQSVVVDMLDSLMPAPGHRVLELGTGTGWNAALLALRVGPGRVTSVEADPRLAAAARTRLEAAGADVTVVTGDGRLGHPPGGPYDRVESTYAVETVPWEWVAQTRPGGRIVTPWGRMGHVALTVAADGLSATGWVQGLALFMPARGTPARLGWREVRGDGPAEDESTHALDVPRLADPHLLFALRVLLPDVETVLGDRDGPVAWVHDGRSSWAVLTGPEGGPGAAFQGGPRRLLGEIERAVARWEHHGRPDLYDFGMTRTPDSQYVWSHDSDTGHRWATVAGLARAPVVAGVFGGLTGRAGPGP